MPRHVKSGDTVIVTAGSDKGKSGEVLQVIPKRDKVIVQGINMRKKNVKPTQANPQGAIISKEMPIHISNVSPMIDGKPSRVRFVTKEDGSKVRVAVRNNEELHTLHSGKKNKK